MSDYCILQGSGELCFDGEFNRHSHELFVNTYDDSGNWHPEFRLSVNQVQDLMSHLQRALDEHGDKQ